MIAVAVANQPRLLIADEPTNSLESITALQIFRLLSSMNQNQGTTILLASNDLKVSVNGAIAFRPLLWAKYGIGATEQLLETPSSPLYASVTLFCSKL